MNLSFRKARTSYIVAATIFVFYLLPFVIEGENSIIAEHDNLESAFPYYVVLAKEGKTFALNPNTPVESIMEGLPRMFLPSGFNPLAIFCFLFPPYFAYLLNFILVHAIALAGMYVLLRKYVLPEDDDLPIVIFTALAFSLIPFFVVYGITVAGLPFVLYSILNFYNKSHSKKDYVICALFPFYSFFAFTGIFIIGSLGIFIMADAIRIKSISKNLLIPFLTLTGGYLLSEYQLFYFLLFRSDIASHRLEIHFEKVDFEKSVEIARDMFLNLQYHASNAPHFIIPLLVVAFLLGIVRQHKYTSLLVLLFAGNLAIAFIQVLFNWNIFAGLIKDLPFVGVFQWNRFYFLSPVIWYLKFGVAIKIIYDSIRPFKWSGALIVFLCSIQFYFLWKDNNDFRRTADNLTSGNPYGISFRLFYSEDLFKKVAQSLSLQQHEYRVGCVGFHPAIAQYNGFYTIDGYQNNYPLSYKKKFRNIIAHELEKENSFRRYFDEWGSRCYLFVHSLGHGFNYDKWSGIKSAETHFNFLSGPEVDYILSAIEITNYKANDLELLNVFETDQTAYKIYLYRIKTISLAKLTKRLSSLDPASGVVGVVQELDLPKTYFDSLKIQCEILPRKVLLSQSARFKVLVVDSKDDVVVIPNTSEIKPEDLNIHLLANYWDYSRDILLVAAPTTLQSLPIKVDPGVYELSITGESTVVENVTSLLHITFGEIKIAEAYLQETTQELRFKFTVDKATVAPLLIAFVNDYAVGYHDRNFWLRNVQLKKVE